MIHVYTENGKATYSSTHRFIQVHGMTHSHAGNINPCLRMEIRDFPTVPNLIGPMYDGKDEFGGTKVRYEDQYIYDRLSI
jgi:hypothetical protein